MTVTVNIIREFVDSPESSTYAWKFLELGGIPQAGQLVLIDGQALEVTTVLYMPYSGFKPGLGKVLIDIFTEPEPRSKSEEAHTNGWREVDRSELLFDPSTVRNINPNTKVGS